MNSKNLNVLNLNCQGVKSTNKYTLLLQFISELELKPDVIFLTDHWLDRNQVESFHIENYKLISSFGRRKKERGGSLILLLDSLKCKITKMKIKAVENLFEICGAKIEFNCRKVTLISLYRPSNPEANQKISKFFENLGSFLEKHRGSNDIILAGDLNINLLVPHLDNNAKKLIDIVNTYDLYLINNVGVTRAADNVHGGSLIDHIFSNVTQKNTFSIIYNILSDHNAVFSTINLPVLRVKDSFKMSRNFSDENWEIFMGYLSLENWQGVYSIFDIDTKSEIFMTILINGFEKSFPLKRLTKEQTR